MSNKIRAQKLKCCECKKSKPIENYSKRQLKQECKRKCSDCVEQKKLANLNSTPSTGRTKGDGHLDEVPFDGFYYTSFCPDTSSRTKKKKKTSKEKEEVNRNVIDNDPNSARNPLGINQYTDITTPFPLLSDNRQRAKLREVKTNLKDSCDKVLNNIDDVDLQDAAKSKYVSALYEKDRRAALNRLALEFKCSLVHQQNKERRSRSRGKMTKRHTLMNQAAAGRRKGSKALTIEYSIQTVIHTFH